MQERFHFQVSKEDFKKRLDDFLLEQFPTMSRLYLRETIRDEKCEVNGRWENRGYLLKVNDFIEIDLERRTTNFIEPEPIPLEIIYEDAHFLVVNKPAEMLVHPTVRIRTGTLLNALDFHLNYKKQNSENEKKTSENTEDDSRLTIDDSRSYKRAGMIHRLDKQTSGLMVIGKMARSSRILCSHFQRKLVEKRYFALVEGVLKEDSGTIDAPVGRFAEQRLWSVKADGKRAISNFWVRKRFDDATLVELEPVTGRTNQLRIHLAHIDHPIVGDTKYGGRAFRRLCLHAYKLEFWHPNGGERLKFETSLPDDFELK